MFVADERALLDLLKARKKASQATMESAGQLGMFSGGGPTQQVTVKPHLRRSKKTGQAAHVVEHRAKRKKAAPKPAPAPEVEPEVELTEAERYDAEHGSARKEVFDYGEKIRRSRKELADLRALDRNHLDDLEAQGESYADQAVTREKLWPKEALDVDLRREAGDTPGAVRLKLAVHKAIGVKPDYAGALKLRQPGYAYTDRPTLRAAYYTTVSWLAKAMDQAHTYADVAVVLQQFRAMVEGFETAAVQYAEAQEQYPGLMERVTPDNKHESIYKIGGWAAYMFHDGESWRVTGDTAKATGIDRVDRSYGGRLLLKWRTAASGMRETYLVGAVGMGKAIRQHMGLEWRRSRTASALQKAAYAADRMGDTDDDWAKLGAAKVRQAGKRAQRWTRAAGEIMRTGGDPVPPDITPENLATDFNLRGVQFGRRTDDAQATARMQQVWGGLSDLADVLGLDKRALTDKGELAIAIGARGRGSAMAHYEPRQRVINLTLMRGHGTLAHEWGHFMDHMLSTRTEYPGRGNRLRASYSSEGMARSPEAQAAFNAAVDAIKKTKVSPAMAQAATTKMAAALDQMRTLNEQMKQIRTEAGVVGRTWPAENAEQMRAYNALVKDYNDLSKAQIRLRRRVRAHESDGTVPTEYAESAAALGPYWAEGTEMFARAFEAFVEDELKERSRANTFLVAGTAVDYGLQRKGQAAWVYPRGEERAQIRAAMRQLVDVVAREGWLQKAWDRMVAELRG